MDAEGLATLYRELNFPSARVFFRVLQKRRIPVRLKNVEEFVRSRSERQVMAGLPKYEGKIISFDVNDRWAAYLIAFTSCPAKGADWTYTHVSLVQDIFSRFLWARPLRSTSETTGAFRDILRASEDRAVNADPTPRTCTIDRGPEFTNRKF